MPETGKENESCTTKSLEDDIEAEAKLIHDLVFGLAISAETNVQNEENRIRNEIKNEQEFILNEIKKENEAIMKEIQACSVLNKTET